MFPPALSGGGGPSCRARMLRSACQVSCRLRRVSARATGCRRARELCIGGVSRPKIVFGLAGPCGRGESGELCASDRAGFLGPSRPAFAGAP